jgi:hypothetical protein
MGATDTVLASVIAAFVRSGAAVAIVSSADRMAKAALCATAAAVLVTASLGCALAALWIRAIPYLGPAGAPLAVAGVLLAGSLAALGLMRHITRPRRATARSGASPELSLADAIGIFKDHKGTALLAAVIAGLVAGRSKT